MRTETLWSQDNSTAGYDTADSTADRDHMHPTQRAEDMARAAENTFNAQRYRGACDDGYRRLDANTTTVTSTATTADAGRLAFNGGDDVRIDASGLAAAQR